MRGLCPDMHFVGLNVIPKRMEDDQNNSLFISQKCVAPDDEKSQKSIYFSSIIAHICTVVRMDTPILPQALVPTAISWPH